MNRFDAQAATWDEQPRHLERAQAVAAAIRDAIPLDPALTALEYGAGTGLVSVQLADDLGPITLADSSPGMIETAAARIARTGDTTTRAVCLDLVHDDPPASQYDVIYSVMALHHVSDVPKVLGALHGLTRPDGWLALADLDAEDGSFHHGMDFDGHHGFDRDHLGAMLTAAGFRDVAFSTCYEQVRQDDDGVSRSFPVFLAVARA